MYTWQKDAMNWKTPKLGWKFYRFLNLVLKSRNGILLPKLFRPALKKNFRDQEKLLKFMAEGQEFAKFMRSLEQFIQTVKGQNNFW